MVYLKPLPVSFEPLAKSTGYSTTSTFLSTITISHSLSLWLSLLSNFVSLCVHSVCVYLQTELNSQNSPNCMFKILPRYKVRSVGDEVSGSANTHSLGLWLQTVPRATEGSAVFHAVMVRKPLAGLYCVTTWWCSPPDSLVHGCAIAFPHTVHVCFVIHGCCVFASTCPRSTLTTR